MSTYTVSSKFVTIPVDSHGEVPTCRCGLGADGMGSSTMAPCVVDYDGPNMTVLVIGWSDPRAGGHEVCIDCGTVVVQGDENARLATVTDAIAWTEAQREIIFYWGGDKHTNPNAGVDTPANVWTDLRVWNVVGLVTRWNIADGQDAWEASFGTFTPTKLGRY